MKLRTRLVLAFVVCAVIPLGAIVLYSYTSSLAAFTRAVQDQSRVEASALSQRMVEVRQSLDQVLYRAGNERFAKLVLPDGSVVRDDKLMEQFRADISPVAPLLEGCEFTPVEHDKDGHEHPKPDSKPRVWVDCDSDVTIPAPPPEPAPAAPGQEPAPASDVVVYKFSADNIPGLDTGAVKLQVEVPEGVAEIVRNAASLKLKEAAEQLAHEGGVKPADIEAIAREAGRLGSVLRTLGLKKVAREKEWQQLLEEKQRRAKELLGHTFSYEVWHGDQVVGRLNAQVRAKQLLLAVLGNARQDEGEIPFAIDPNGQLHTRQPEHRQVLEELGVLGSETVADKDWVVVKERDEATGLVFGIARPLGKGLEEIRSTAANNFALGLVLVGFAAVGVLPLSRHMTRNLQQLTGAVEELAKGDLGVRIPIRSKDEIGQLATAFNRMAEELDENQDRLLAQELENRLLDSENQRKSRELESARQFQLSLLPGEVPEHPGLEIAVAMYTATEVGGDYYDFQAGEDGSLVATIGDATGHGATAGTMVTVAKSLFSSTAGGASLSGFLHNAGETIRRMRLPRMCMAMMVAKISRQRLEVSAAGMPPLLLYRETKGSIEEVLVPGVPLGALRCATYHDREVSLAEGDTVLLMSDGFPELANPEGEPLGYDRAQASFASAVQRAEEPQNIIEALMRTAETWRGDRPQDDDITFVVMRVKPSVN